MTRLFIDRKSLSFQPGFGIVLCAGIYFEFNFSVQGINHHFPTQYRDIQIKFYCDIKIIPCPLKKRIRFNFESYIKIPIRTTVCAGSAMIPEVGSPARLPLPPEW